MREEWIQFIFQFFLDRIYQIEDEAVAGDEAAWEDTSQTFIEVPNDLVPVFRELLAKKQKRDAW